MKTSFSRCFPSSRPSYTALQSRFSKLRKSLVLSEKELWGLFTIFCDANQSGGEDGLMSEHELGELLCWHEHPTPLEVRLYLLMRDSPRGVTFRSFLVHVWAICVQDPTSLAHLAFQLYDVGGKGSLNLVDLRLMFREAFGPGFEGDAPVNALFRRLSQGEVGEGDNDISLLRFLALAPIAASLLAPIFRIQRAMQGRLLGEGVWEGVKRRRDAGIGKVGGFNVAEVCRDVDTMMGGGRVGGGRRQSVERVVLPVTDRHFLPSSAIHQCHQEELGEGPIVDHPGFNRPFPSPGRGLTPIEHGMVAVREGFGRGVRKAWRRASQWWTRRVGEWGWGGGGGKKVGSKVSPLEAFNKAPTEQAK